MKLLPVLAIIGIILIAGCVGQQSVNTVGNTNGQPNENDVNTTGTGNQPGANAIGGTSAVFHKDFQTVKPTNWNETEVPPSTYIYTPQGTNPMDAVSERIIFSVAQLPEDLTYNISYIVQAGIDASKDAIPSLIVTKQPTNIVFGTMNGLSYEFTFDIAGQTLKTTQIAGMKYNKIYSATHYCPSNCMYSDIFNTMVNGLIPKEA